MGRHYKKKVCWLTLLEFGHVWMCVNITKDCTFFQVGFQQNIKEDWTLLHVELDIVLLKIAHFLKLVQLKYPENIFK